MIEKAVVSDSEILTEIAIQSKGYWGYTTEQLESWRKDLTVSKEHIAEWEVYKFVDEKQIAGFYALGIDLKTQTACIEFLFVLPTWIGKAIGIQLLQHAFENARSHNMRKISVVSDPNAKNFYAKYGFREVALEESSIPDRYLPVMEKILFES